MRLFCLFFPFSDEPKVGFETAMKFCKFSERRHNATLLPQWVCYGRARHLLGASFPEGRTGAPCAGGRTVSARRAQSVVGPFGGVQTWRITGMFLIAVALCNCSLFRVALTSDPNLPRCFLQVPEM